MNRSSLPPPSRAWPVLLLSVCLACLPPAAGAAPPDELEASFREFLGTYTREMRNGNRDFVAAIHPDLPEDSIGFFIGLTLDMMSYAAEEGLSPAVACRENGICKAVWPQPGGSWAAQTFIRREGRWVWLEY
ncbi:MAG: hypothetical protein JSV00_03730 [bacterium]|nr:MAG: hypothetical protein JSV00_03730 [bacterium]